MKKLIAILLALLLTLSLAACGDSTSPIEPDTENPINAGITTPQVGVSITVVTSYGGDDGNRRWFAEAVKTYEASTGNTVIDNSATSNEEWKAKVLTDFETGSEPDVLFFFTNADANAMINAGKVVSIEEIREVYPDYATNMRLSMMSEAADGKHYAVPSAGIWENLFVNKKVLHACGIPVPGPGYTWDQFLIDCETIKNAGYTPIACSLYEVPHYWFEFAVMNNGTLDNHLELPEISATGSLVDNDVSHKWIAALNDIRHLYECGYFPENTMTATDSETVSLFADGQAAFLIDGSWKVGYLSENYPDKLDNFAVAFVPGKGDRVATNTIGGISMGYFITRKAWDDPSKREAAVKFVSHVTSDEVLNSFVTTEVTALVNGISTTGLNVLQHTAALVNSRLTGFVEPVQDTISSEARSSLFTNIPKVVTGKMTAEEAVESAMKLN